MSRKDWDGPETKGQQKSLAVQKNRNWLRRKLRRMGVLERDYATRARRFVWPPKKT